MKKKLLLSVLMLSGLWISACTTLTSESRVSTTEIKPNYDQAYEDYVTLGAEYVSRGRYDLAEPKLKRAIEIDSEPPEAWNILAVLYEETRDIAAGNQIYQKLINSHPNYALGFMNYATFLCKFDRTSEREALYAKMLAKGNNFSSLAYIARGNCDRKQNNIAAAQSDYKQALSFDNHAAGALLPLADIANEQGDYQQALKYLNVVHTYVGYTAESVKLTIIAARGSGDTTTEEEMMRVMRSNYQATPQAKSLGI